MVSSEVDALTAALYRFLNARDTQLRLALYTEDDISNLQALYPEAKFEQITNFSNPFRALPRDNDIVILKDIFHKHQAQERLLKTAYTTLANSAEIIIMQKKGTMDIPKIVEMLQEYEFRTPNYIDILPDFDLVIARKMHMWGNGL